MEHSNHAIAFQINFIATWGGLFQLQIFEKAPRIAVLTNLKLTPEKYYVIPIILNDIAEVVNSVARVPIFRGSKICPA